jgi:teichuronic acid biosynthesis glycosyltransferase TuaH
MNHNFIRNRDIVFFGFQPWESEIGSNFKDMALELARFNRVLFVNRALDRNSLLKQALGPAKVNGRAGARNSKRNLVQLDQNLWLLNPQGVLESINWSPSVRLFDFINRINNRRLAAEINQAISRLSFREIIFVNDNDFFRGLYQKELVPCETYIYYIRDYLTIQPFFRKFGPRSEKQMIKNADLVVANSAYLAEYARRWNPKSFDIGQGCAMENFAAESLPMPADMASLPRPIIGYCGFITDMRLDMDVVGHIARSLPHCSLVLVGPTDALLERSELSKLSNVHFLGRKAPETIQNYIYHFDICINPQSVNPLTIGNYPRKVDEYLAAGKPVVATATEAMRMFKEYTFLCSNKEEFVERINRILSEKALFSSAEQERRRNFALGHTWENSMGCMGDAYFETVYKNQKAVYS